MTGPCLPPSLDEMEAIAARAFETIPAELRDHVAHVIFRVQDFPDQDVLDDFGIESPFDLMGLYQGVSLDRKSVSSPPPDVDMIFLYRRPILDYWCETGEDLEHVVRHVLIHEIGHHFGLSDADMDRIEAEA